MLRTAQDAHNLRMVPLPNHHRDAPLGRSLADNIMDVGNVGAGCVQHGASPVGQRPVNGVRLPMGADQHRAALRGLLRAVDGNRSQPLQPADHMVVVGDVPQQIHRTLPGRRLRQLHRPAHTVAEPGGLGQQDVHAACSPSARIRSIRSSAMR